MGKGAVAIFLGSSMVQRSNDTDFPFRQESDFWYLTGFDHPGAVALLRTDGGPEYTLYVEPRDPATEIWTGYRPGVDGAVRDHAADEAHPRSDFLRHLADLVGKVDRIHHVLGRNATIDACITGAIEDLRRRSRQGTEAPTAILDPRAILHELRLFKSPEELDIMRRAAAISADAHTAAARLAHPGTYEYELQAILEYTFRRRGARGPAYTTIVGGGSNATVLHYVANDSKLTDESLVLIDAGCELEGYASDVTRTYPVGGRFTGTGRALYEVVLSAQLAALDQCRPGHTLVQVHEAAVRRLAEGLVDLELLSGDVEEIVSREEHKAYCMHNTSHWLGLDSHDVGAYRREGSPRPLEPGMVFTVEPGLYISESTAQAGSRFRGIGVRIEDDVVVTEDGHENLNAALPKTPDELEALVSER
ncbi:MAG: M24 family metallopeptidase [bacterium]|jgi:Xaa-Pro aminopeptidase|nr:Xaa-Pro aminopeptidase [Deltaproteobacteria bacterium]MCP4242441.1 M24 family metallopeptidase [bacterium]